MRDVRTGALAQEALVRLLAQLDSRSAELTVIGGLNPPLLAPISDAPHQGTVDVDLAIDVAPVYDRDEQDFGWLERALVDAGFTTGAEGHAWRWTIRLEEVDVHLDVLCDVLDNQGQELALPGTRAVTAMNLRGPAAALAGTQNRLVAVGLAGPDSGSHVEVRYAGLGGYLLAKAAAVVGRRAAKDSYDLAFVVLHNPGGPAAAGMAARRALPVTREREFAGVFRAALSRLDDPDGDAVVAYATQRVRDGEHTEVAFIRRDVVTAARACAAAFDEGAAH